MGKLYVDKTGNTLKLIITYASILPSLYRFHLQDSDVF